MIYLSRLMLDPLSRRVQKELSAPYEMHRTLCHAFPGLSDEEWRAARVLFRVDDDNDRLALLVQSHSAPDWNAFAAHLKDARYLRGEVAVKAWEPRFENGQSLRFRLQANPVFAPKEKGAKNGTRRGLFREAERLDWLRRQSETHGFELDYPRDENGELISTIFKSREIERNGKTEKVPVVFRGQNYDEHRIVLPLCEMTDLNDGKRFALPSLKTQFSAARFEGVLQVRDTAKFTTAVENGIGKARGFGFGLLSVAPATK